MFQEAPLGHQKLSTLLTFKLVIDAMLGSQVNVHLVLCVKHSSTMITTMGFLLSVVHFTYVGIPTQVMHWGMAVRAVVE